MRTGTVGNQSDMRCEVEVSGRRRARGLVGLAVVAAAIATLAGCGVLGHGESNPQVYGLYDKVPEGGGVYKIGQPYQVDGQWFTPRADAAYDHVGIASWYGEDYHGRKTANGEWYDMNRLSAAHPTLPLPVYARVTNLQNGRSLVLRVNDRGPFARGREIDVSKRAAEELGFLRQGTAQVRVTYLADAPLDGDVPDMQYVDRQGRPPARRMAAATPAARPVVQGGTRARVSAAASPGVTGAIAAPDVTGSVAPAPATEAEPAAGTPTTIIPPGFYVQVAAFANPQAAQSLAAELAHLGDFAVLPVQIGDNTLYRVRTGPLPSYEAAAGKIDDLAVAGHEGARIFENR